MSVLHAPVMAASLLTFIGIAAAAAPFTVACEKENIMFPDEAGPLQVTYAGGPEGEIAVASAHVTFKLQATEASRSAVVDGVEITTTAIQASGETPANMPDPQALLACAAGAVQPEFKDDADMVLLAVMGCTSKTPPAPSPIPVQASVTVALVTTGEGPPEPVVEIKRRYRDATLPNGGPLEIDTFPGNCKLVGN